MVLAFLALVMFCGLVGVLFWLAFSRVRDHMRRHPEAAKLFSEHVITPLLMGKQPADDERSPEEQ